MIVGPTHEPLESTTTVPPISICAAFTVPPSTEIAVLEMKEQMMSYMAKIVVLDAMNLAENVSGIKQNLDGTFTSGENYNDPENVIDMFTKL